jgi:hypothetical protein
VLSNKSVVWELDEPTVSFRYHAYKDQTVSIAVQRACVWFRDVGRGRGGYATWWGDQTEGAQASIHLSRGEYPPMLETSMFESSEKR